MVNELTLLSTRTLHHTKYHTEVGFYPSPAICPQRGFAGYFVFHQPLIFQTHHGMMATAPLFMKSSQCDDILLLLTDKEG